MSLPAPTAENCAVITGASGGIGSALAVELASRGYSLILTARRAEVMEDLAAKIRADHNVTVEIRPVDLADATARKTLCDELGSRDVAILCNNAGIATFGALSELDPAYEKAQVELNVVAVHDLTLAVLPQMVERKSGGILNVGSAAGNMAVPNNTTYAASKAFVNTFSESLRGELFDIGVHVSLLAPGPVRPDDVDRETNVDNSVPDFLWSSTAETAKESIDGLAANKMRIVPGTLSKLMSVAGTYSPRSWSAPIVGAFYKKMGG